MSTYHLFSSHFVLFNYKFLFLFQKLRLESQHRSARNSIDKYKADFHAPPLPHLSNRTFRNIFSGLDLPVPFPTVLTKKYLLFVSYSSSTNTPIPSLISIVFSHNLFSENICIQTYSQKTVKNMLQTDTKPKPKMLLHQKCNG